MFRAQAGVTQNNENSGDALKVINAPNVVDALAIINTPNVVSLFNTTLTAVQQKPRDTGFPHLIYAYMLENTRVFEIVERVIQEFFNGERLGPPSDATRKWMQITDDFFYSGIRPFGGGPYVVSRVRADIRAARRNAYYRMFGLDLNHGTNEGQPYPYEKPKDANRDFVPVFEEFLRQVWQGMVNKQNTTGPKSTDDDAVQTLALRLDRMLEDRRRTSNGMLVNLQEEEVWFVGTMSWLHMSVQVPNSPVLNDLRVAALSSTSQRILRIGEIVGLPAHARSENYLKLAEHMSRLLNRIERGDYGPGQSLANLYDLPGGNAEARDAIAVINNWSMATGRDLKVQLSPAAALMAPSTASAVTANGRLAVGVPAGV